MDTDVRSQEHPNQTAFRKNPSSVKMNVHYFLPHLTRDQDVVEVNGCTVGECMYQLAVQFPEAREWLFKDDNITNLIDIYVKKGDFLPVDLNDAVEDGDEIYIVMMISGG